MSTGHKGHAVQGGVGPEVRDLEVIVSSGV